MAVSLYGEVQKQVIAATLADDFGVRAEFAETTVVCIERPVGVGSALQTVPLALRHGRFGWSVTDCRVTPTHTGYWPRQSHANAVFEKKHVEHGGRLPHPD